jgi:hypothetical protein
MPAVELHTFPSAHLLTFPSASPRLFGVDTACRTTIFKLSRFRLMCTFAKSRDVPLHRRSRGNSGSDSDTAKLMRLIQCEHWKDYDVLDRRL